MVRNLNSKLNFISATSFIALMALLPLTIRKVVWGLPIRGAFNEYSSIYIYASDIMVLLVLLFGYSTLRNLFYLLSSALDAPPQKECSASEGMFHVEHPTGRAWNILRGGRGTRLPRFSRQHVFWISTISLFLLSYISYYWSDSHTLSSVFALRIGMLVLLAYYVSQNIVPRGTILYISLASFSFSTAINGLIGIVQYLTNHSLGLRSLWESILNPQMPGVAKILIGGVLHIRAYGLLPHPNILGGLLTIALLINVFLLVKSGVLSRFIGHRAAIWFIVGMSAIQLIALALTFSKSAWLALIIGLTLLAVAGQTKLSIKPRGIVLIIALSLLAYITWNLTDLGSVIDKSLTERRVYENVSRGTIFSSPLIGIGSGNYVFSTRNLPQLADWQFQPVHNSFLLIWSELGVLGLILFLWITWGLFTGYVPRGTLSTGSGLNDGLIFKSILIAITTIMIFDHYFWDIQQGKLIFWILVGILAGYQFGLWQRTAKDRI